MPFLWYLYSTAGNSIHVCRCLALCAHPLTMGLMFCPRFRIAARGWQSCHSRSRSNMLAQRQTPPVTARTSCALCHVGTARAAYRRKVVPQVVAAPETVSVSGDAAPGGYETSVRRHSQCGAANKRACMASCNRSNDLVLVLALCSSCSTGLFCADNSSRSSRITRMCLSPCPAVVCLA